MKKIFLLIPMLAFALMANATNPTITIDGDKSDWAEVPMLSEPGTWPMLKVIPAADAELGTNALVYMMENTTDFDPTWAKYPKVFIDKDYDGSTHTIDAYWAFPAMGLEYSATTGVNVNSSWVSFPKAMSSDNKVFEIGFPATYITDLGSKFSFGMYYNSGAWFCPDYTSPAVDPSNGFLYKTRSYTTVDGTTTLTTDNVYAHQSMGEIGAYVDFGLRDNGDDTARWAAFPIEITQPAMFDVTTNVTSTNGWKFEFWVVDVASNAIVAHIDAPASNISSSKTSHTFGTLDLTTIPAGKYMLKVKNRTQYSTVKLNSVELAYAGGHEVAIPSTLNIADAIITNGKRQDGVIKFDDATTGTAKWNGAVTEEAYYDISVTIKNKWGHNITVAVYEEDGTTLVDQVTEGGNKYTSNEDGLTLNLGGMYLKTGKYVVKYSNATSGSDAKIVNVEFTRTGGAVQNMPGTTVLDESWFSSNGTRANGKISYSDVENGCWAKWNIALAKAGDYKVIVNICGQYGHQYAVEFLKEGTTTPIVVTKNTINYTNDATLYANELGIAELEVGNYEMKVSNAVGDAALISITLVYQGGGMVNIPCEIDLYDAILSTRAFIDGTGLHFTDDEHLGTISGESAKWNIHAAGGIYTFTAHCSSTNYSNLTFQVLDSENHEIYTYTPQYTYKKDDKEISSPEWFLEEGDYILKLSNPANHSNGYLLSLAATAKENVLILDEQVENMDLLVANNGNSKAAVIKRTFRTGVYNSICVPFNVSSNTELKNIFGEGYELLAMTSATLDGGVLTLNFAVPADKIEYGRPYLIKPTKDVENPVFNAHTIYKSTSHLTVSGDDANFVGVMCKQDLGTHPENLYLGADGNLYFSNSDVTIKGFRGYFHVKVSNAQQVVKHARIVAQGQTVTAIDLVEQENNDAIKTIKNGQLIIIKNGVRYNVQGQKIQ